MPKKEKAGKKGISYRNPLDDKPTVKGALSRIGGHKLTGATLVVTASTDTKATPEQVWSVWSQLEKWPTWAKPQIKAAKWIEKRDWEHGAKFELTLGVGMPLSQLVNVETVKEVNPPESASWWKSKHEVKSCHIWFFEPLEDGGTRITQTEVMVGFVVGLLKPFFAGRMRAAFKASVEALARASERAEQPASTGTVVQPASS